MTHAVVTLLSDVEPHAVEWLWTSYIPLGMLTVLDGDPGLGKSTILADLTARLSRGDRMPDGSPGPKASGTVILSAEDDGARVIRPRLDAARADPHKITFVRVADGDGSREPVITAEDMLAVEEAIEFVGARLVIIDPLMAYLPANVNSNRDQDVRRTLVHLRDLAERSGAAVVVVRHLNKTPGGPALYRGGGSIGIIGAARAGLLLAADPDWPESGRILAVTKSNLARIPPSMRLQLVQEEGNSFASVAWGNSCDLSAKRLLAAAEAPQRRRARTAAAEFLRGVLADGPVPTKEVEHLATEEGIAAKTLQRAREVLGVVAEKVGQPSQPDQHWAWRLPADDEDIAAEVGPKKVTSQAPKFDLLRETRGLNGIDRSVPPKGATGESDHLREGVGNGHPPPMDHREDGQSSDDGHLRWPPSLFEVAAWSDEPWEASS
jgi:putative DNA primase/helicase